MSKTQLQQSRANRAAKQVRRGGFTLIELLLVLVILVVLAGIAIQNFGSTDDRSRARATKASISTLDGALERFKTDTGRYPTTEEGLGVLMAAPADVKDWGGPYLKAAPKDGWDRDFKYTYGQGTRNPNGFDLVSAGKDGQEGTDDDIANWTAQ